MQIWEAERLGDVMSGGRTHPMVLGCSLPPPARIMVPGAPPPPAAGRQRQEFVVKALGLPEVHDQGLFCEYLGGILAAELGIDPQPAALVNISDTVAPLLNGELATRGYPFRVRPGLAVGSEYLPGLATMPRTPLLTEEQLSQALGVYCFDQLVQNPDRRADHKPNCGVIGQRVVPFDFELCFSFLLQIGKGPDPWRVTELGLACKHLFYKSLKGKPVDFSPFIQSLEGLSDETLKGLTAELPASWQSATKKVLGHLVEIRGHAEEFEIELRRSLA